MTVVSAANQHTAASLDRLRSELDRLVNVERPAAVHLVEDTRSDGLNVEENFGYMQAREAFERLEGRIATLKDMVDRAVVVDVPGGGTVGVGSEVTLDLGGDDWTVVVGQIVDASTDVDVVSPQSPLGHALLGTSAGAMVTWTAPSGPMTAKVVAVS